jgi:phosphatidylglycerophosphatase A
MKPARRNDLVVFFATGCFSGFLPKMPGTWGTFAAIPLVIIVHRGGMLSQTLLTVLILAAAVPLAGKAEALLERRDARPIVIDEMCGFLVSLLWLPFNLPIVCLAFVLFRFFDIVKPPPIDLLESHLKGGWGIVMDDVMAGAYTNISIRILSVFLGFG